MIEVREAATESELNSVRTLVQSFIGWLRQVYPEAQDAFDQDARAVEADLASLPSAYGSPTGKLLVAYSDGEVAGTVALRDMGQRICEMQRMFVEAKFRGQGIGRVLATALINDARALGYRQMWLSTGQRHVAAQGLYRSLGFQDIPAYHEVPESLRPVVVFMGLRL